jgi:hypothetical protein
MKMYINDYVVKTSLYIEGVHKNKHTYSRKYVQSPILALELNKMERIASFSLSRQEFLNPIKVRLMKYCTSYSLNASWNRENYFLSPPHNPLKKISPQKASIALMCPSEIENFQEEIQYLLKKGIDRTFKKCKSM